jgi:hypothetical protein
MLPDDKIDMRQGALNIGRRHMRTNIFTAGATALFLTLGTINEAMAVCIGFGCDEAAPAAPEFDGPAGIFAVALLVGVVALVYHKVRR